MKLNKRIEKTTEYILIKLRDKNLSNFLINTVIDVFLFIYIRSRFQYLNSEIPLWYTKVWGDAQLAPKFNLYLIPLVAIAVNVVSLFFTLLNKYYIRYLEDVIWYCVLFFNLFIAGSVLRIIRISSVPFSPFVNPLYVKLLGPMSFSFIFMFVAMPYFIDFAKKKKLVTNPQVHSHPGMILSAPSARGGGVLYSLILMISGIIFVGLDKHFSGLYISLIMISILSFIDDYQNTHPKSVYRFLENPVLRLFLLFISVIPVVLSGVMIYTVSNPFGGFVNLNVFEINILNNSIPLVPLLVTSLWIVWLMNVLSWSNGVDGQFPGIVGIASSLIALLALRFDELTDFHYQIAVFSAISAGAAFGSVKYNWHPSKIMWGFGAMSAGLTIASLAILAQAKIAVSVLILLIPFLDALFTVSRRVLHGKNPFKGDRGHLHHLLLDRGWSVSKVAIFYWFATALFGLVGLFSPERVVLKLTFLIMGVVAFGLIILNISSNTMKKETPPTVLQK